MTSLSLRWRRTRGKAAIAVAPLWRRCLRRTLFVGVTGSCGKTTAKELTAAVLSRRLSGTWTRGSQNELFRVAEGILATRPHHRFRVQEVGAAGPGSLDRSIALLRPDVAVVLNVGLDHYSAFRGADAVAVEKSKLVVAVPWHGAAVLNADDPRVLAMRHRCRGRVTTVGTSPEADLRALSVGGAWPERLWIDAVAGDERVRVRTRLCGAHWTAAVLSALAVGRIAGIPLGDAAAALEQVEPPEGRMSPVVRDDGVVFIRDDSKAPLWSLEACLQFLRAARAPRKVIVVGTLSDSPGNPQRRYRKAAEAALDAADLAVFVGRQAALARRARRPERRGDLAMVPTIDRAAAHLADSLRPGDLVLLKGSFRADGLGRLLTMIPHLSNGAGSR